MNGELITAQFPGSAKVVHRLPSLTQHSHLQQPRGILHTQHGARKAAPLLLTLVPVASGHMKALGAA